MEILRDEIVSLFTCIPHICLRTFAVEILATSIIVLLFPAKSMTYSAAAGIMKEERIHL